MENNKQFIELGKGMGLSGNDLAAFVDKRESMMREAETKKRRIIREKSNEREERMKEKEFAEHENQALLKFALAGKEIELAKINASKADSK